MRWQAVFLGALSVLCIDILVDGAVDPHPCHVAANSTCHNPSSATTVYCGSDGKKYHGFCAFLNAYCDNHMHIIGYGESCTPSVHVTPPTHPPPSQFETELFNAITHGIDDRLVASRRKGISAETAKLLFTKQDHTHNTYVRNPNCWAHGLNLTPISPWNSNLHNRKAGTLISPRHAVWARHYNIKLNSTLRFVDLHNNVVERRIIKSHFVQGTGHSFFGQDIVVGELDHDVPSTIDFSRVMPRNLTSFRVPYTTRIPVLSTDQEEKALVEDFYLYSNINAGLRVPEITSMRYSYYEPKISGDSGNPTFFVINNQLVLLFVFTTGGAGGGTSLNHYFDDINRIMRLEGGKYQLTEVDLRGFLHNTHVLPAIVG